MFPFLSPLLTLCLQLLKLLKQNAMDQVAKKQQPSSLTVWTLKSPQLRCQKTQCLVRTHFLVHRWCLLAVFTWQKGLRSSVGYFVFYFLMGTNSTYKDSNSWPYHFSKVLPPNTLTLGIRFQHMNLWEDTKHSIYSTCPLYILNVFGLIQQRPMLQPPYYMFAAGNPVSPLTVQIWLILYPHSLPLQHFFDFSLLLWWRH